MTDTDLEALAWQFLSSDYASDTYVGWPLDRRLESFLRHCGLTRVADDGDGYNQFRDRVMSHISAAPSSNCRDD